MFDSPVTFKEAAENISGRMDRPTAAKYKDIMATWSPGARQRAFFSSRVMDATVLSGLHDTVQKVISGEMTEKQAVRIIRERFAGQDADALAAMGFAPKKDAQGVTQLASIRRIQLIVHTNVRMAQECGHYKQWEAVKAMYPYAIWHCGYAENHRRDHLSRDGKLYPFEHPIWRESPPGGEFNCHCWREPVMEEDAGAKGLTPQPLDSAFEPSSLGFDPSRPMSGEDVEPNKSVLPDLAEKAKADPCPDDILPDMDTNAAEEARLKAEEESKRNEEKRRRAETVYSLNFPNGVNPVIPDNIDEIKKVFDSCERALENGEELPTFDNIPVGELLPVQRKLADLGLKDYRVFLSSPGSNDYGMKHWERHHADTINASDAIGILAGTLWNPQAELRKSVNGGKTRLSLSSENDKIMLANVYLQKNDNASMLKLNLIDLWYPSKEYINSWKR